VPLERLAQTETRLWEQRRQRFGEFKGVELVGSERRGPESLVIVRLVLERGSTLVRFMWDGVVLAGRQVVDQPPAPTLLPVSPTEFTSFSLRQPSPIRLRFDGDAGGAVHGVTISAGATEVVAKKTG
jgi:hypothetical protein